MAVDALLHSFLLVFISEMGDKTQLLSLVLVAKLRKPWTILAGILVATLLNHALASWAGDWLASLVTPDVLRWILAGAFFAFAAWVLVPDKEGEIKETSHRGAFLTTLILFFMAEMGDKTQLVTVALGAKHGEPLLVTLGSTAGMVAANAPAVFLGPKLLTKVPMGTMRIVASLLFILFGAAILLGR